MRTPFYARNVNAPEQNLNSKRSLTLFEPLDLGGFSINFRDSLATNRLYPSDDRGRVQVLYFSFGHMGP